MLRKGAFLALVLGTSTLGACSAAPPPIDDPKAAPSATVAAPAAPAVDLSPVSAPKAVVAKGRARNVAVTLGAVGALGGLPPGTLEKVGRGGIAELFGRRGLRLDVDAQRLAGAISLDAPVDLIVALPDDGPPQPYLAVSVGLSSPEEARAAAGANLSDLGNGMLGMSGEKAKGLCAIAPSSGPTAARLVCGPDERAVSALAPYLARTASLEAPPASDVSLELDVAALDAKVGPDLRRLLTGLPMMLGREVHLGNPTFDQAADRSVKALAEEAGLLLGDLGTVRLDAKVSERDGLLVDGAATFRQRNSWLGKQAAKSKNQAVPGAFLRVSRDAEQASYSILPDPADAAPLLAAAKDLLVGLMASEKVGSEAERKKVAALLDFPLGQNMVLVRASGHGRLGAAPAPKTPQDKFIRGLEHQLGWHLFAVSQKSDAVNKWLTSATGAMNQPGLQAALKKASGGDVTMRAKPGTAPAALGKGAAAVEITLAATLEDKKTRNATMHLVSAADGDTTWIAVGFDKADLVARITDARAGGAADKTIASRPGLTGFASAQLVTASFFTLESFRSNLALFFVGKAPAGGTPEDELLVLGETVASALAALPEKGETPATMTFTSDATSTRMRVVVPRGALADAFTLAQRR